ncbi:MAG: hypothetical protein IEMM0008_1842 [bacterium]|nr:MAG: hypothetical protein IEMM0008_1842 [bacterium]
MDPAKQYADTLQDTIVRYIGTVEDEKEEQVSFLKNPFIWIREGVKTIIALPVSTLFWFGLISGWTLRSITHHIMFKTISLLALVIGILSGLMSMILGWDKFLKFLGW